MKQIIFVIIFTAVLTSCNSVTAQIKYDYVGQYRENKVGWVLVVIDNKSGFIDEKGKEVVKPKYDYIGQYDEIKQGYVAVLISNKEGFIDYKGNFCEN